MSGIELSGADALLRQSSLFSVPHDPASIVVYVLLAVSGFAIWYGDRRARKGVKEEKGTEAE